MRKRGQHAGLDIAPVLDYYGGKCAGGERGWFAMRCPFHDDRNASARVTFENGGAFKCHGCDAQGDAISLIIQRGDAHDFHSALDFYERIGGTTPDRGSHNPRRRALFEGERSPAYEQGSSLFSSRLRRGGKD